MKKRRKKRFEILLKDNLFMKKLPKLYPNVPIEKEIRKMKAWIMANPNRLKKNWKRFMVNWLNKAADQYPAGGEVKELPTREDEAKRWLEKPDPAEKAKVSELIHKTAEDMK